MSSQALLEPVTQLFRDFFEQASLGIAVEDFAENILVGQSGALVPAVSGYFVHEGVRG
jgi:hypothetical protein